MKKEKTRKVASTKKGKEVPAFKEGDVHSKGWIHQYTQESRVAMKKGGRPGVVKAETCKSVWVLFDGDRENRLKRKTSVKPLV